MEAGKNGTSRPSLVVAEGTNCQALGGSSLLALVVREERKSTGKSG